MTTENQRIIEELHAIKEELGYIKEHMVDRDMFLTKEEKKLLAESYENEQRGELTSQEDLEKELEI